MIATEFWGVKVRKTSETLWSAGICRRTRELARPWTFLPVVRKETVRNPPHVLDSARTIQSRGEGKG